MESNRSSKGSWEYSDLAWPPKIISLISDKIAKYFEGVEIEATSVTRIRGPSGPAKHSRFTPLKGVLSACHLAWPSSSQTKQFLVGSHTPHSRRTPSACTALH